VATSSRVCCAYACPSQRVNVRAQRLLATNQVLPVFARPCSAKDPDLRRRETPRCLHVDDVVTAIALRPMLPPAGSRRAPDASGGARQSSPLPMRGQSVAWPDDQARIDIGSFHTGSARSPRSWWRARLRSTPALPTRSATGATWYLGLSVAVRPEVRLRRPDHRLGRYLGVNSMFGRVGGGPVLVRRRWSGPALRLALTAAAWVNDRC
jgi:hypothetical protein